MRPILSTLSEIHNRRSRVSFPAAAAPLVVEPGASRERAIREASLVRRVLRGAKSGGAGAAGAAATIRALEAGTVRTLFMTRRFRDTQPAAAANVDLLARAIGIEPTILCGVGAFELDMVAGGVGALLQRPANAIAAHAPA